MEVNILTDPIIKDSTPKDLHMVWQKRFGKDVIAIQNEQDEDEIEEFLNECQARNPQ